MYLLILHGCLTSAFQKVFVKEDEYNKDFTNK